MSTLGRAVPLHLRLFIEDVEVPVIGAVVTASEGSAAIAQVELLPASSGLRLAARSKILLFFLAPGNIELGQFEDPHATMEKARSLTDAGYKLLFNGELFSVSYSKTGYGSRSLVLQCLDDSNNWDTSYLYTLRYSKTNGESAVAGDSSNFMAMNANANQLDDILNKPEQVVADFARRDRSQSASVADAHGIVGGLFSVLELIGGVQGKYLGVTAWHSIQEARIRLMDQLGSDSGETSSNLFDLTVFDNWLMSQIGDAGTVVSFRDIIDLINRFIYYTVAPNPVAVYREGSCNPAEAFVSDGVTAAVALLQPDGLGNSFAPEFVKYPKKILELLQSPTWGGWDGVTKPAARISSATRSVTEQEAQYADKEAGSAPRASAHIYGYAADFSLTAGIDFGFGDIPSPAGGLHERLMYWAERSSSLQELYGDPEHDFKPDAVTKAKQMVEFYKDLKRVVESEGDGVLVYGAGSSEKDPWLKMSQISTQDAVHVSFAGWQDVLKRKGIDVNSAADAPIVPRERLLTQFFRPDIWFVAPPACNVIFPEEVSSLSYNRDMMRETTRLQLSTINSVVGDDIILNQVYFAPDIRGVESLSSGGMGTAAKAFIYPHEKFSGIVPKMERKDDLSFYSRLTEDQKAAAKEEGGAELSATELATSSDNQLDKWAAHTAIFSYLSYRYSARSLSLSLKFTPRIVVGFPAMVVEGPPPENIPLEERAGSASSPNHFLGMVRSVTHVLNQSGGSTSVSMSHARTHKTDLDDIFSSNVYAGEGKLAVQVRYSEETPKTVVVNDRMSLEDFKFCQALKAAKAVPGFSDSSPPVTLLGPGGRTLKGALVIERVPAATSTQLGEAFISGKPATAGFVTGAVPAVAEQTFGGITPLPEGVAGPAVSTTVVTRAAVAGRSDTFDFTKVSMTLATTQNIPLEEAIRPPWMSDEYGNAQIGEMYMKLLGCPSVMELYDVKPQKGFAVPALADVVEKIVDQYARISGGGYLGASFIDALTQRDYASYDQVMDSFYKESMGDKSNLDGPAFSWLKDGTAAQQLAPGERNKVDPQLDPRRDRHQRAKDYQNELLQPRGIRG